MINKNYPLLGLFNQGVPEDLPGQVLHLPIALLQGLVDRHGSDRDRRVPDDPVPDVVNVSAGRQIHDGIGTPPNGPHHFLHLLRGTGAHGGVTNVGIYLE